MEWNLKSELKLTPNLKMKGFQNTFHFPTQKANLTISVPNKPSSSEACCEGIQKKYYTFPVTVTNFYSPGTTKSSLKFPFPLFNGWKKHTHTRTSYPHPPVDTFHTQYTHCLSGPKENAYKDKNSLRPRERQRKKKVLIVVVFAADGKTK